MLNVKNTMIDTLLSVVAPHLCSGCGQVGSLFCDNCKYDIIAEPFSGCVLCEKPSRLGICADHKAAFNQAFVVSHRSGALQRLIGGFKFRNMKSASASLADLLDSRLPRLPDRSVFVPIPTAPPHIRERGYDHMLLVATTLASKRHVPLSPLLVRTNNLVQHKASRRDRVRQAQTAFKVEGKIDPLATYIVVDDIVTTGATINQAALLLRQAGATSVWIAAIARQPLD
jgi:ComF family protein